MANFMKVIAKKCLPKAIQVTDRFHIQNMALETLQDIRIKYRWEAIEGQENELIKQNRIKQIEYEPELFEKSDTRKQLLARSRYLLYKAPNNWTLNQHLRSKI